MNTTFSNTQSNYEAMPDPENSQSKILKGIITKDDIKSMPEYSWYAESQDGYPSPDAAAVDTFTKNKDKIYFVVFGGTWCEDTHFVLPKFYRIQEVSGFPENRITLFGVDRDKHTNGSIAQALNMTHTPTIIVMKNGEEIGRVVEFGKTGKWDQELAEIINSN